MDVADLVGAALSEVALEAPAGRRAGTARGIATLAAFFAGGALWLAVEGAVAGPARAPLRVHVAVGADAAERARAVDEAVRVEVGLGTGWRGDALIVDRLTRAVAEVTPEGVTPLEHAEALGLHRRDPLVQARLAERARRAVPEPGAPSEAELRAFFEAERARFRRPAVLTLAHRFARDGARAEAMLAEAREGREDADSGEPELGLGPRPTRTVTALKAAVGEAAAEALVAAELGAWTKVRSPLGWHVVKVTARREAEVPALAEIRAEVLEAWREARRRALEAAALARWREAFEIEIVEVGEEAPR